MVMDRGVVPGVERPWNPSMDTTTRTTPPTGHREAPSRQLMHAERRKLTRGHALARVPRTPLVTLDQLMHAAALTSPLPIRKWIHQGRLTPVPPHADRFARQDVIRFLHNRFSPYSLLEARLYRAGVTLMAATGSTGDLAVDQPRLRAALARLVGELGSDAYARAVDRGAKRVVLPRMNHQDRARLPARRAQAAGGDRRVGAAAGWPVLAACRAGRVHHRVRRRTGLHVGGSQSFSAAQPAQDEREVATLLLVPVVQLLHGVDLHLCRVASSRLL